MYNTDKQLLEAILAGREERTEIQKILLKEHKKPLVSFTLNIPGPQKSDAIYKKAHKLGLEIFEEEMRNKGIPIIHKKHHSSAAGFVWFFCIDWEAIAIKGLTVAIEENNRIGRLFDFDVFNISGKQISRVELGFRERKCILCEEKAILCRRNKTHSLNELINVIYNIIDDY